MALRQKPINLQRTEEQKIDQIINKGGTVAPAQERTGKKSNFPLRFMQDSMSQRIEATRKRRHMPPSINSWINEAILEKLERDEQAVDS